MNGLSIYFEIFELIEITFKNKSNAHYIIFTEYDRTPIS